MAVACLGAAESTPRPAESGARGARLSSAYQPYRLGLTSVVNPPSGAMGLILKARVNGGPVLRLLVDSGAQYLVLDRKAARKSGQLSGAELDLVGAGASPRAAHLSTAGLVSIGEVVFRECPIVIVDGQLLEGIDGVFPLSLFGDFLIRLDVPRRILELEPYPVAQQAAEAGFVRVKVQHQLLFLETRLEDTKDVYLLLDTGSSYNVISNTAAGVLGQSRSLAQSLPLVSGAGKTDGRLMNRRVSFRFGTRQFVMDPAVVVDLAEMSRRHRIDVAGVIGYPALAGSVVTVNYRESLVSIQPK